MTEPREELIELVTPDLRATCLEARDKLIELQCELDAARDESSRLKLYVELLLQISDRSAIGVDIRTCALIRENLGLAPRKGKPVLAVVKNGDGL